MDSKAYWAAREAEALNGYVQDEKEYDRQIQRIYQNQLDSIQKEINSFYGKYASKEGITIAEAKKRVLKLDIAEYERKAAKYVKEKNFSQKANEEMALYNLTMKVNRLELLKANIGLEMIAGTDELDKYMAEILKGRTMDELKRMGGILGESVKANSKNAHAIPNASFHNATFSDRIWMYQDLLKADLSKLLQTGLIQGKNPRALASELKKVFDTSTYNAERLMRTELARVQTEAQKQSYQRNGFSLYEYIANSNCCGVCQGLNGKHFKVESMMPGENAPPMHPHCRCSTAAWEDSEEYDAWVDYLASGGTTEKWNASEKFIFKSIRRHQRKQIGGTTVNWNKTLENSENNGTIKLPDIQIYRSVGAKAKNYNIILPNNEIVHLTEGTRVTNVQVIAGKGRNRQIDELPILIMRYPDTAEEKWQKVKGIGYVDYQGESYKANLHWYEEPSVGRVEWKVKPDADGNWFIEDD